MLHGVLELLPVFALESMFIHPPCKKEMQEHNDQLKQTSAQIYRRYMRSCFPPPSPPPPRHHYSVCARKKVNKQNRRL
ncbi:hypothetical protein VTJ04DRAFT_7885 [Mycothermus thermophilus]|uniref:uncharacterized protein n=1 Tax=Humicola insolens TaxID=85995 RepID=UPI003744314A